jgi:hypothetical protein
MPSTPLALDKMVDLLAKEDEYWRRTYNDPRLLGERKRDAAAANKRHVKRIHASHYLNPAGSNRKEGDIIFDLTNNTDDDLDFDSTLSHNDNSDNDDDIADLTSWTSHYDSTTATTTATTHAPVPYISTIQSLHETDNDNRKRPCPSCECLKLINKQCTLKVCKQCCASSTAKCKLTHHNNARITAAKPYEQTLLTHGNPTMPLTAEITLVTSTVEKAIQSAINNKRSVYISYLGGTGGEQPRRIDPKILRAVKNGQVVEAYCHLKKKMRTFSLHKIKRIEDHEWVSSGIPSSYPTLAFA